MLENHRFGRKSSIGSKILNKLKNLHSAQKPSWAQDLTRAFSAAEIRPY